MKYRFSSYTIKDFKYEEDFSKPNFAMMIPQRCITKEEMRQYALMRLRDIIDSYGIKFYEYKK